jgi:hypothetical protein
MRRILGSGSRLQALSAGAALLGLIGVLIGTATPSFALPEPGASCSVNYYCASCSASIAGEGASCYSSTGWTCLKYSWFGGDCTKKEYTCQCSCSNDAGDMDFEYSTCSAAV